MHLRVAWLLVCATAGVAAAQPPSRCGELRARGPAQLDARAQERLPGAEVWARGPHRWPVYVVSVTLARAPHLAREILADCPGVISIDRVDAVDDRRFTSQIQLHVTSFAALSRILQLPAVRYVDITDPTIRIKHPMPPKPMIDFD